MAHHIVTLKGQKIAKFTPGHELSSQRNNILQMGAQVEKGVMLQCLPLVKNTTKQTL